MMGILGIFIQPKNGSELPALNLMDRDCSLGSDDLTILGDEGKIVYSSRGYN